MAADEPSILDLMQEAGREPPRVRLPAAVAEGGDDGDGAAVGRTGRYEVLGLLAEGGVGEILKGRDLDLGRDVALKVLRAKHRGEPRARPAASSRRPRSAASSSTRASCPVYELGLQADGGPSSP